MPCTKCGGPHADILCRAGATQISAYRQMQATEQALEARWLACVNAARQAIEELDISDNNIIDPDDQSDLEVDPKMDALRDELDGYLIVPGAVEGSIGRIQRVAELVLEKKVGNCQEQAYLAFDLMRKQPDVRPLQLIRWGPERGNNHVMVLAGSFSGMGVYCDPWARISGSARNYPADFMARMNYWRQQGFEIAGAGESSMNPCDFATKVIRPTPKVLFCLKE
jgi:hypothetical protein